jgi:hypothetical protein
MVSAWRAALSRLPKTPPCTRTPKRFALPYHVVFCLAENLRLMGDHSHALVRRVEALAQAAGHDIDKMPASLRFREIGGRFVAWFEPVHHLCANAGLFAGRFAALPRSILALDLSQRRPGQVLLEGRLLEGRAPTARRRSSKTSGRPTVPRSSIPRGSRFRPCSQPCRQARGTCPKPSALRRSLPAPRRGRQP